MGNRITRISRRTFKIKKKKKSKQNDESGITNNKEPECDCSMFPATKTTPICIKCVSGIMQELEENRLNARGHWRIIENSTSRPICGSQFDAKKFDEILKMNTKFSSEFDEPSENDDSPEFEDTHSDSFPSEILEINFKKPPETINDCDNQSNNSYASIFELFEKLEYDAKLNSVDLDEMFFYPAFGDGIECDESKKTKFNFNFNNLSSSSINVKKDLDKTKQNDGKSFDETHLYDTVASSEEISDVMIDKLSKNTSLSARRLKSCKPDDLKCHGKKHKASKSKKLVRNGTQCHTIQPIPFNATQFDTKQIDDAEFVGILFNDSQFDAKYFDATQFDVTPYFDNQIKKSQISASKLNSARQFSEIHPYNESQFHASHFNALKCDGIKNDSELFKTTENQCDDAKIVSTLLNAERSDVKEFEAALIRTAEYVASHFGSDRMNDKQNSRKDFITAPFYPTQFNGSQFDAKQFDVSQFSSKHFDISGSTQFCASQFDAKAFDVQKFGHFHRNLLKNLKF